MNEDNEQFLFSQLNHNFPRISREDLDEIYDLLVQEYEIVGTEEEQIRHYIHCLYNNLTSLSRTELVNFDYDRYIYLSNIHDCTDLNDNGYIDYYTDRTNSSVYVCRNSYDEIYIKFI